MTATVNSSELRAALSKHAVPTAIHAGTVLSRAHPHLFGSTEFDMRSGQDFRFSTLRFKGAVVPVLYASANREGAACETIFRNVPNGSVVRKSKYVMLQRYAIWQWSELEIAADLRAFHLDSVSLSQVGTSSQFITQSDAALYWQSRQFAEAVLDALPWCQALTWPSRQHSSGDSYMFFGPTAGRVSVVGREALLGVGPSVPFASSEGAERLAAVAEPLGITLVTG